MFYSESELIDIRLFAELNLAEILTLLSFIYLIFKLVYLSNNFCLPNIVMGQVQMDLKVPITLHCGIKLCI